MDTTDLRADCGSCFGLCCAALAFTKSADFAEDKAAGDPCRHLGGDHTCGIHDTLRGRGYAGCTVYDCFGAGQKVSQVTFGGRDWREQRPDRPDQPHRPDQPDHPDRADQPDQPHRADPPGQPDRAHRPDRRGAHPMFAALPVMRQLHELLWYLTQALPLPAVAPLRPEIERTVTRIDTLTRVSPAGLAALDVAAERATVNELLLRISAAVRAQVPGRKGRGRNRRGADLIGARLKGADLRGADLRGAYLIGADLRAADLRFADLIGADLRGTDLRGADLTGTLFLTQTQVNAARGDAGTAIPAALTRPPHWQR